MTLVECVPNFSEGRNRRTIDEIVGSISAVEGVRVLDVEVGEATNRTVVTFIGPPERVEEAAVAMILRAAELIDMSSHRGAHPRLGATDVCPFVPVFDITMTECVALSRRVGERVGAEGIPVYLYEESATAPHRRNLADIRRGEYEGLAAKLADPEWRPDFGPSEFDERVRRTGATVMGAREFLIAYNVNVNTTERRLAHEIALNIREAGRAKRDEMGEIVRDADGKAIKIPGRLKAVKAIGWYIDEYDRAQVSINLVSYRTTPLHVVFETCVEEAERLGLRVTGSEIIGLVPKEPLVEAGRYFLRKQGRSAGVPERDLIRAAILSLGLSELSPFVPEERIIEYIIAEEVLPAMTVRGFMKELSRESPAPGGGSVASLAGALGAALTSMVAVLTHKKKGMEEIRPEMEEVGVESQSLMERLLRLIDLDTEAFDRVMSAIRMKARTDEERVEREAALRSAYLEAAEVPLETMGRALDVMRLARRAAEMGNPSALSDAGSAAIMARAAVQAAALNVRINLKEIDDPSEKDPVLGRMEVILEEVETLYPEVMRIVNERGDL
ncbi:MAG TPA: glutamate formimidoyltransferase [Thermoplasmata archaeon]|nr:glutamate formimidoyltransferase [Thermoplasmata archaeon]